MAETKGVEYLRRKLAGKRVRVLKRYRYYEMKNAVQDFNLVTPPEFRAFQACLGWCGKAVDALADRLVFRGFREDNFDLTAIYRMNNADVLFDSAVLSALITSCCFLHITADADGYPLLEVVHGGDATGVLDEAMEGTADAIAEAYRTLARGATLIFSVSVRQCREIAAKIPGAVVVTGETEGRAQIVRDFTEGKIPCLVNCMVFTEGTDIPRVETVILARPTQSDSLYTQMVGRGLRPYPGKESLLLIDCVGTAKPGRLQTAPSLMGVDLSNIPERRQETLEGDLLELPVKAAAAADCPESWIRNVEIVNLWAREQQYQLHEVNWFRLPDGRMTVCLRDRRRLTIPCPDALGRVTLGGELVDYQTALDRAYRRLRDDFPDERYIWDTSVSAKWGRQPASEAQLRVIRRQCQGFDTENLTKGQAIQILNRLSQRWADGTQKPGKAWA